MRWNRKRCFHTGRRGIGICEGKERIVKMLKSKRFTKKGGVSSETGKETLNVICGSQADCHSEF